MTAAEERLYAQVVGEAWRTRYRERFEALESGGSVVSFNPEAAFTPLWGFWRLIPLLQVLGLGFVFLGSLVTMLWGLAAGVLVPTLLYGLTYGLFGDWLYWRRLRRLVARMEAADGPKREQLLKATRTGGVLRHHLVAVPLALLAYLVIFASVPPRRDTYTRAYRATVKADLRNLVTAQEAFHADSQRFAMMLSGQYFLPSSNVTVTMLYADTAAFAAVGTHARLAERCWIYFGEARGLPVEGVEPPVEEGVPFCRPATADERPR